jgi:hypothetical protein
MIKKILAAAFIGTAALGAQAAGANLLNDGDFESTGATLAGGPSSNYCYLNYGADECGQIAGWSGGAALSNPTILTSDSPEWGSPNLEANFGSDHGSFLAGVQGTTQLVSDFTFVDGATYTLTWTDANRVGYGSNQTYDVTAGGRDLGSFTTIAGDGWATHTETFTADGSGKLTFTGTVRADATAFIDNVTLTSAVPEPASLLLMMAGVLPLLAWRRRAQV